MFRGFRRGVRTGESAETTLARPPEPVSPAREVGIPPPTKLQIARKKLEKIDAEIASCLGQFRAVANPEINPDAAMIAKVQLPEDIEQIAIDQNTPAELFKGVALFLAIRVSEDGVRASRRMDNGADKTAEFKRLCELLCERHDASRLVVAHKTEHAEDFRGGDGRVITFVPEQHYAVVERMHDSSVNQGYDGALSSNIINWIAAVNAGWQDMAINENTGPFVHEVTKGVIHELRDPRPTFTG